MAMMIHRLTFDFPKVSLAQGICNIHSPPPCIMHPSAFSRPVRRYNTTSISFAVGDKMRVRMFTDCSLVSNMVMTTPFSDFLAILRLRVTPLGKNGHHMHAVLLTNRRSIALWLTASLLPLLFKEDLFFRRYIYSEPPRPSLYRRMILGNSTL